MAIQRERILHSRIEEISEHNSVCADFSVPWNPQTKTGRYRWCDCRLTWTSQARSAHSHLFICICFQYSSVWASQTWTSLSASKVSVFSYQWAVFSSLTPFQWCREFVLRWKSASLQQNGLWLIPWLFSLTYLEEPIFQKWETNWAEN